MRALNKPYDEYVYKKKSIFKVIIQMHKHARIWINAPKLSSFLALASKFGILLVWYSELYKH